MPESEEKKLPAYTSGSRGPDLRGRYRDLAIPAVVAACMAQKDQRRAPAVKAWDTGLLPPERD